MIIEEIIRIVLFAGIAGTGLLINTPILYIIRYAIIVTNNSSIRL